MTKKTETDIIEAEQNNFKRKLVSLKKTMCSLKELHLEYVKKPDKKISQMALIKSFELAFELSWKTLQAFFRSQGYREIKSPKDVIKSAFNKEMLIKGEIWIDMLSARNKLAHIYDESMFQVIIKKISNSYVDEIERLYKRLEKEV